MDGKFWNKLLDNSLKVQCDMTEVLGAMSYTWAIPTPVSGSSKDNQA